VTLHVARPIRRRTIAVALAVAALGGCRQHHPPDPAHDVDIVTPDFVTLKASYFSPGKAGPGILLIHQCNMDRHACDTLTPDLVRAGFHVLTFDQRGFGDTSGSPADEKRSRSDVDAGYAYLRSKPGVERNRMAAGGASCGVNASLALAQAHADITALLLLSGAASDSYRAHVRATPSLAVFGAAADREADELRSVVKASRNPESVFRAVRGNAHGAPMFDGDPDLKASAIKWLAARFANPGDPR